MTESHPYGRIVTFTSSGVGGSGPVSAPTTRGFFAVAPGSLQRALEDARSEAVLPCGGLSVTARSLAAFAGRPVTGERNERGPTHPLERLVCSLDDELWFLGTTPGWVASGLLVPLGADPEEAAALTEGMPLGATWDGSGDGDGDGDGGAAAGGGAPFPGLSVLDGTRAPVWRSMLRAAARRYETVDPALLQWLAFIGEASPDGVDRLAFSLLALLTAVVDFADNGHEVLVAAAAG